MTQRVLVVDDEEAARSSIKAALESAGCEVLDSASGQEALDLQQTYDPDVIVTDINMPGMDGWAFLRQLAARPDAPPAIMVTSHGSQELAVESLRQGAFDYITKPFDPGQLANSVRRAAERRQLRRDNVRYQRELEEKNRRLREAEEMLRNYAVDLEQRVERGALALLETELRYREVFNLANDAIFTIDSSTGLILDANQQAERVLGYSHEELTKMNELDLHPSDEIARVQEFNAQVASADCGCGVTGDLVFRTKDGKRVIFNVSCSAMEIGDRRMANRICRDVTRIREMEAELNRYTRALEQQYQDKTRALLESQAQLIQTEKMAALGSLVAGVAHEINTPLGSINSNNDIFALTFRKVRAFVERRCGPDEEGQELTEILSMVDDAIRTNRLGCERIVKIVRSLRNFARLDEAERKKADIHEGIESTLTLVAHELKRRITVVKEFGEVREIECYPNQLNQVFMNMLVNASQAIEGEGEIRIKTWEEGGTVRIAISDNGKGIPPEMRSKVFDPGFTTKKAGLGTGLGLSICYKIIQEHGGRIELDSEVGRGTTFTIVLPIQEAVERQTNA